MYENGPVHIGAVEEKTQLMPWNAIYEQRVYCTMW